MVGGGFALVSHCRGGVSEGRVCCRCCHTDIDAAHRICFASQQLVYFRDRFVLTVASAVPLR